MTNWKEKVVVVTGASSGIGRATAEAFAARGARVMLADVGVEAGEDAVRVIKRGGGEATFTKTDVSRAAEVAALIERTINTYGRIDCAFNNAGIEGSMAPVTEVTEESFDRIMAVNLKGVWLCMKYELPHMLAQKRGAIVNCSSIAGLIGFPQLSPYVASKHGVVGLTQTAALEYARQGIRVNAVCPGAVMTPMLDRVMHSGPGVEAQLKSSEPVGRLGRPEEIASAVVWLSSDEASFVTGQALAVDGGWVAQ